MHTNEKERERERGGEKREGQREKRGRKRDRERVEGVVDAGKVVPGTSHFQRVLEVAEQTSK